MPAQLQGDLLLNTVADFFQTVINHYAGFNLIQNVFKFEKAKRESNGQIVTDIGTNQMPSLEVYRTMGKVHSLTYGSIVDETPVMVKIQIYDPIPENLSNKLSLLAKAIALWIKRGEDPSYMNGANICNVAVMGAQGKIIAENIRYYTTEIQTKTVGVVEIELFTRCTLQLATDAETIGWMDSIGFVFNPTDTNRPFASDGVTPVSPTQQGGIETLTQGE